MDLTERVSRQFHDNAHATLDALEALAAPIAAAAEVITSALLDNGKVLVCGDGHSAGDAARFAAQLVHGFELERPSLAALALHGASSSDHGDNGDNGRCAIFARQLQALAHPGDVLVTICASAPSAALLAAIAAAHERDVRVIALSGADADAIAATLGSADVHVHAATTRRARTAELHLLILHCLCDGIDCLLLGVED